MMDPNAQAAMAMAIHTAFNFAVLAMVIAAVASIALCWPFASEPPATVESVCVCECVP